MANDVPIHQFTSHIEGKNAIVKIYADRLEWERPRGVSAAKITAGIMTGGMSLAATGVRGGRHDHEVIPVKAITSVASKRDGIRNSVVVVTVPSGDVTFRVSHDEAARTRDVLIQLVNGTHPGQQVAAVMPTVAPAPMAPPEPMPAPTGPPPGWYQDPDGTGLQRWWDGTGWTEHRQA